MKLEFYLVATFALIAVQPAMSASNPVPTPTSGTTYQTKKASGRVLGTFQQIDDQAFSVSCSGLDYCQTPQVLNPWRAPNGTEWSAPQPLLSNGDFPSVSMSDALNLTSATCTQMGGRLPSVKDYLSLLAYFDTNQLESSSKTPLYFLATFSDQGMTDLNYLFPELTDCLFSFFMTSSTDPQQEVGVMSASILNLYQLESTPLKADFNSTGTPIFFRCVK
jgi:hypothetical protein